MAVKAKTKTKPAPAPQTAPPAATYPISSELEVRIRKRFPNPEGTFNLNVHFRALAGFTILFGASGAGKTTLLDCIAGLSDPDEGRIVVGGEDLYDSEKERNVAAWKRRIGYVHQDLALFALARALVTEPRALLLDEPLAALDRPTKSSLVADLRKWNQDHRIPILFVTHDGEEVFALGDEVIMLDTGRIVAQGRPHEVMRAPRLETVAQLSGFENIFDATVVALHENRGTMTCRLGIGRVEKDAVELETPLVRAEVGSRLRVGVRAGDLLLATEKPRGLSARNILSGTIRQLEQRDVIIAAMVDCSGTEFEVHLTLAARDALQLGPDKGVWVVVKTHSCHLMGM